jgi:probable poly-beta-1,6-N-acetyl-D-glucosamine export protein
MAIKIKLLNRKANWIDSLKGLAIIAVVCDHVFFNYSISNQYFIFAQFYFSVTCFIFLSGLTNAISLKNKKWIFPMSYLDYWRKRVISILPAYVIGTGVCYYLSNRGNLNINAFVLQIKDFSAQPTYYYINLILQLYLIFPVLYQLVRFSDRLWKKLILTALVYYFSFNILYMFRPVWPFNHAGLMFGGGYFFVFYLGILFQSIMDKRRIYYVLIPVGLLVFAYFEHLIFTYKSPFISIVTTFPLFLLSLSFILVLSLVIKLIIEKTPLNWFLALIGNNSYIIYLYHYLVILYCVYIFHWPYYEAIILGIFVPLVFIIVFNTTGKLLITIIRTAFSKVKRVNVK